MSLLQRACKTLGGLALVIAAPAFVFGDSTPSTNYYAPQGGEYLPAGNLSGDQANTSLSVNSKGGLIVWQDNITDGDGLGISALRVDSSFSASPGTAFRVNQQGAGDQENPQVALLSSGAAVVVWQGGPLGSQHIYARFLSASNLWLTGDVQVNTATNHQIDPAVAVLANGNLVVTWSSFGQDNADGFQGIYGQIFTPAGTKVGGEFAVNQFTPFNQRSSAVAALPGGNFLVAWVSEQERVSQSVGSDGSLAQTVSVATTGYNSADIIARVFNSSGSPVGGEFLINTLTNVCANPAIAVASDGSYVITWSQKDTVTINNGWDVWARRFTSGGAGGTVQVVNTQRYGDQYRPKISSLGTDYLVVWTSLGQDGSREGVYGQFLHGDGSPLGVEQRVNTTVLNGQKFQAVGSDGVGRFVVAWSSYASSAYGLDLYAQRFATSVQSVSAPAPPMVLPLDSYTLSVSWPPLAGFNVSYYELYVDGSANPIEVTNNLWSGQNYNPSSTHTFQLAYMLADGQESPVSAAASGTTWGRDNNGDGLPDNWQTLYWGSNSAKWPAPGTLLAPGVTVLDVFLSGANPLQPGTWLKQTISQTPQGLFLNWNTVPGGIYQVLASGDLKTWTPLGSPRFEAGTTDSVFLGGAAAGYYKVVRNRY